MASILFPPGFRVVDDNGNPVSGAKIYVFGAGGTTPYSTYQDSGLSTAHAHPVVCNSGGLPVNGSNTKCLIYYTGNANIKVRVTTSAGVTLWEFDNFIPYVSAGGTVPVNTGGTGATTAADARTNLGAAAASDLSTITSTVSTIDGQLTAVGGTLRTLAGKASVSRSELAAGFGTVLIQRAEVDTETSVVTCNTSIPVDNSIPQNTEGVEVLNGNFTPVSASSFLVLEFEAFGTSNTASNRVIGVAMFQGTTANALAAVPIASDDDNPIALRLWHRMASPGTSTVAFKVRVGITSSSTFYVNGDTSGTRLLGGIGVARLVVSEYLVV